MTNERQTPQAQEKRYLEMYQQLRALCLNKSGKSNIRGLLFSIADEETYLGICKASCEALEEIAMTEDEQPFLAHQRCGAYLMSIAARNLKTEEGRKMEEYYRKLNMDFLGETLRLDITENL
jgi:hypothetical protein